MFFFYFNLFQLLTFLVTIFLQILGYNPDGYNFGVNDGEVAGQTIFHVHFHVIPRYQGDDENPRGGIRKIKSPIVAY